MIALLVAPVLFSFLGAAVLSFGRNPRRMLLSPIVGVVTAGWLAEIGFLFGNSRLGVLFGCVAALMVLAARRNAAVLWMRSFPAVAIAYLPAVATILVSPYPGVCLWYGDYVEYFVMGEGIRINHWTVDMLRRPPLFGAATITLRPFAADLHALEAVSAVSAAGALLVLQWITRCSTRSLWTIAALPFFFLHTATCWPKILSGGCIVAALTCLNRRDGGSRWMGTLFFAAAFAAHTGASIMVPLFIVQAFRIHRGFGDWARDAGRLLVSLLLIPGPFEIWSTSQYGLEERRAKNPAIFYVRPEGLAATVGWNVVAAFTGYPEPERWSPPEEHGYPWFGHHFMKAVVFLSWQAGTFLGLLLPLAPLLIGRRRQIFRWLASRKSELVAVFVVILLNAFGVTMVNLTGITQTGLTPICLLLLIPTLHWLDVGGPRSRWARLAVVLVGLLPCVAVHVTAFVALRLPEAATQITDVHQRMTIVSMFRVGLNSICLDGGFWAAGIGAVLFACQAWYVIAKKDWMSPRY